MFLTPSQHCLPSVFDYDGPPANQKRQAAQSRKPEAGGGGIEKADETVGGKECTDEREVTAESAQQMLQL